jgi:hypothetical protein
MEDTMFRTIHSLLFFLCSVTPLTAVHALDFSKDTIDAFDGKLWEGYFRDDSVKIINTTNQAVVIDSIGIEFDTSGYEEFSISWVWAATDSANQLQGGRTGFFTITDSNAIEMLTTLQDLDLARYNRGELTKIQIAANDTVRMYSPYFSKQFSLVGVEVDCAGGVCVPPGSDLFYRYFPGRIIFVSQGQRDTLHLNCELFWWELPGSVVAAKPGVTRPVESSLPMSVDLLGKVVSGRRPFSAGVMVQKGRVLHRIPGQYRR